MEDFKLELDRSDEDTVYYEIHPAGPDASAEHLQVLQDACLQVVAPFTKGYIWQREALTLHFSTEQPPPWKPDDHFRASSRQASTLGSFAACKSTFIWGATRFGDNVEDEWFITWLLVEITRRNPGVAARVWDNDGEFLLIEAAYALPKWLKPETASNRVWLLKGLMHIVPLPTTSAPDIPSFPTLQQARQIVQGGQVLTVAGAKMQAAVAARLKGYPQKARRQMHKARAILPAKVAAVLHADPGLAGLAVDAFYNRDVDDMQAAARMRHFAPQDMLSVVVTLNRCMYAQLEQQEFEAPSGFSMPPAKSPQHSAAQRGMKLSCGFEMLYAKSDPAQTNDGPSMHEADGAGSGPAHEADERAVSGMPAWLSYKADLERNGYFQGNIPGSQKHKELLQQALHTFLGSAAYRQAAAAAKDPARRVDAALQGASIDSPEDQRKLEEAMQAAEDDDSWMRDGAGDLERELAAREEEMTGTQAASSGTEFDPDSLAQRFKVFIDKEAGPEGAEIPSAAAAAGGAADVSMDYKRFWRELGETLGMQPGDSEAYLKDMESDSNHEGSSFFGDNADETNSEDEQDTGRRKAVFPAQHAERAARSARLSSAAAPAAADPNTDTASAAEAASSVAPAPAAKPSGTKGFAFRFPQVNTAKPASREPPSQPTTKRALKQQSSSASRRLPEQAPRHNLEPPGSHAQQAHDPVQKDGGHEAEQWDAMTETDSDDDFGQAGSPNFMSQYAAAMEAELGSSNVGNTFARLPQPSNSTNEGTSSAAVGQTDELQPVDLNVNLVENLLASYAGQQGLPGPASNLAGLMGISLPDNKDDFA